MNCHRGNCGPRPRAGTVEQWDPLVRVIRVKVQAIGDRFIDIPDGAEPPKIGSIVLVMATNNGWELR